MYGASEYEVLDDEEEVSDDEAAPAALTVQTESSVDEKLNRISVQQTRRVERTQNLLNVVQTVKYLYLQRRKIHLLNLCMQALAFQSFSEGRRPS